MLDSPSAARLRPLQLLGLAAELLPHRLVARAQVGEVVVQRLHLFHYAVACARDSGPQECYLGSYNNTNISGPQECYLGSELR